MDFDASREIAQLEHNLADYRRYRDDYARRASEMEKRLRELKAPFAPGQKVRPIVGRGRGARCVVDAIERAFGDWVVLVHFPSDTDRQYTYQAHDLEAVETDEVPF